MRQTDKRWEERIITEAKQKHGFKRWQYVIEFVVKEVIYADVKIHECKRELEELRRELRKLKADIKKGA